MAKENQEQLSAAIAAAPEHINGEVHDPVLGRVAYSGTEEYYSGMIKITRIQHDHPHFHTAEVQVGKSYVALSRQPISPGQEVSGFHGYEGDVRIGNKSIKQVFLMDVNPYH